MAHYKNGQLKEEIIEGIRIVYFEDGTIKAKGSYNGKMNGQWLFYKKTGSLWQVGNLKDDIKDGSWIRYNDDGSVEKEMFFEAGKEIKKK